MSDLMMRPGPVDGRHGCLADLAATPLADFLPFALPDITSAEIDEVVACLRSGWITTGPKVARFEREFAAMLGSDVEAVAVSSATAGLHLALEAAGIGPGDEVIVPVHTFTATAEVVVYLGATPVFVDVLPGQLTMDPEAVEAAITPRTRALMPVHYAGLACDMRRLIALAERHGLAVIEDAAHALPTTHGGILIGAQPTLATVFSFYATKTVAAGEGGMLVTRDPAIARRARVMRLHGINRDVFDRYQGKGGGWYYEVVAPGFKYNLTDIGASLALVQLARMHEMRARREFIARAYLDAFDGLPVDLPPAAPPGDMHAWHLFPILVRDDAPMSRNELIDALRNQGIGTSVHYVPLHMHPYWRDSYVLEAERFPVSTDAYRRMVSLPIYSKMSDGNLAQVVTAVRQLLGQP
ncbi:MAG TPA: DegT/DnrJ/EryC1/StrS family aminotransferase [Geminicoccus sp.]|jgi:dTDP-4-amino-4,6-dideoxygalactose transaminase|uniref:DegT/DnrJ/EryC1/StrS family aminotransferase n=1 Tax=Geminicoccus sp. TaxID=2024832 RepID=UPI002E368BD4|nr:DegT/DnrJ/EryC1/StrS family aminotransferase [Geminicoccus sp.]HEX2526675.1 DegT/DnrJ/EryC1/StrS family aminotransferase [Geminicoccus sp.]